VQFLLLLDFAENKKINKKTVILICYCPENINSIKKSKKKIIQKDV